VRTFVSFEADFPDDAIFGTPGNPEIPSGRNVAEALVQCLRDRNLKVSDATQHSFYGWEFLVEYEDGGRFWFLLQYTGPWLLLSQARPSLRQRLLSREPQDAAHGRLLHMIDDCLKNDRRFSNPAWFTKEEFESSERAKAKRKP
jgi:hypothetical protein